MARSKLDTLIYATILLAPMVTAAGYIALAPTSEIIVVAAAPPMVEPTVPLPPVLEVIPPVPATPPIPVLEVIPPVPATPPVPVLETSPPIPAAELPAPEADPVASPPFIPRDPDPLPAIPGAGMLMYEGQVVLLTDPDVTWSRGQLRSPEPDYHVIASKAVDAAKLPAALAPLVQARVVVYDTDGSACTATTGAMTIYAQSDDDLLHDYDGEELEPAELLRVRKEVFAEAQLMLARQLRIADEDRKRPCTGLWARRADLPSPAVFGHGELPDDGLRLRVLAMIDGQPEVASLRAAYEEERARRDATDTMDTWPTFLGDTLNVTRWDEVGGGRSFVNVELGSSGDCGGNFSGQRELLFALQGGELVPQPGSGFDRPLAIMDLERDGMLEAVTESGLRLGGAHEDAVVQRYQFPFSGCSC